MFVIDSFQLPFSQKKKKKKDFVPYNFRAIKISAKESEQIEYFQLTKIALKTDFKPHKVLKNVFPQLLVDLARWVPLNGAAK